MQPTARDPVRVMSNREFEMGMVKLLLYSLGLVVTVMIVGALIMLYRRLRARRGQAAAPAPLGVPVETVALRRGRAGRRREFNLRDPREAIAHWYSRFCHDMAPLGFARKESVTAAEYLELMLQDSSLPKSELEEITSRFVRARYTREKVTRRDVRQFRKAVAGLQLKLEAMRSREHTEPGNVTGPAGPPRQER
jgi:hypothetical protein